MSLTDASDRAVSYGDHARLFEPGEEEKSGRHGSAHQKLVTVEIRDEILASSKSYLTWKYSFDRVLAAVLLVLSSPLIILLAALVKATSAGPAIYRQTRVGLNGQHYQLLKLRSMTRDAESDGQAVWCAKNDVRITAVGRILRKLHLDELPQLWNVARGEMSLVGPRPERPEICATLIEEIPGYDRRHFVKPGITGLAQINLPPDQTIEDVERKQALDLLYLQQTSFSLDMRMISATAFRLVGVKGESAMSWMKLCRREYLQNKEVLSNDSKESQFRPNFKATSSTQPAESPRLPR